MPKAMLITSTNIQTVSEISKWNLQDDTSLTGYWYVEDVQFPHGYVDQAIVTPQTFDATFKIPGPTAGDPEMTLIPVDYK
jgi:hypothetical protein